MADRQGDPEKKPAECREARFGAGCPNLKESGDFDTERYDCKICGEHYTLYYEDMK